MSTKKRIDDSGRVSLDFLHNLFEDFADVYHSVHFYDETFYAYIVEFVEKLPDEQTVLDAGCGTGGSTRKLTKPGVEVVGIDISEKNDQ